jgi:hypothetical protein
MKKSTAKSQNIGGIPILPLGGQFQVSGVKYALGKFEQDTPWHAHDTAVVSCLESGLMGVRTDQKAIVAAVFFLPRMRASSGVFRIFGQCEEASQDRKK